MSLAAGIVARAQGQSDDGPATCGAAHAEQRSGSLGRAWQERRTAAYVEQAPPFAHLLEVLEELRRPVVGSRTRPARIWPCAQNLSQRSRTAVLAKECRESRAQWAWRFERIVARTYKGDLRRGCRKFRRTRVEQATEIASAAGYAPRARGPSVAGLLEPRPAPAPDHTRPEPREDAAPLKNQVVREGASGLFAHPRGAPWRRPRSIALRGALKRHRAFW